MLGNLFLKISPDVKRNLMEKLDQSKGTHSMFPKQLEEG